MMTVTKAFIAFCLLAVIGTALVVGPTELRRLLPVETKTATAVAAKPDATAEPKAVVEAQPEAKPAQQKLAAAAPPAPAASPEPKAATEAQKQATAALADLTPAKPQAAVTESGPRVDVARIDDHGEAAVIAGQAAPGATIELLRDGKPLDAVVADASGQFVMTPRPLPAGSYELTLRAKAPDGTITLSGRTMPVTIAAAAPAVVARQDVKQDVKQDLKQAETPDDRSDIVAALPSASPHLASASDKPAAHPRMMGPVKPKVMARAPAATIASASPGDALTTAPAEAGGSRVISRGDSLWALSRHAYGDGARYAVIFNANRDKIRNPNLIYPGQTVLVPQKPQ
jgi:nucleoid-associated protein YgaU